jgi:ATP-dependent Zn protease
VNKLRNWWKSQSKKNKYVIIICLVGIIGLTVKTQLDKDDSIEIALSDAVELSQSDVFSEMTLKTNGTMELVAGKSVDTIDIEDDEVTLKEEQKVVVDIDGLDLSDLNMLGFKVPESYNAETVIYEDNIFIRILPQILLLGGFIYVYWAMMNGRLAGGGAKEFKKIRNTVKLDDIGGLTEVKENVLDIINYLRDKDDYERAGASIPKGILFEGSPGNGKTLIAQAIATEAGIPFYYTTGSEFHNMFVGMAGTRIKNLFKKARQHPAAIIFIDEFDSIAHRRASGGGEVTREWNHTLNQLLSEMDGFDKNTNIISIGSY